jgi:hypothetical protein
MDLTCRLLPVRAMKADCRLAEAGLKHGEDDLSERRVDKEKLARADRESRFAIAQEKLAREAKTARLRAQRLAMESQIQSDGAATGNRSSVKQSRSADASRDS